MTIPFASRHTRLLVLSFALVCVAAAGCVAQEDPSERAGESDRTVELATIASLQPAQARSLAAGLSRLVGATIRQQDLFVMPARRISGIPPFSSLLDDTSGKWVVAEVATPAGATSFRAAIPAPSTWSEAVGVVGLSAAVVVSSAAIRTCPSAVCYMNGCVTGMATVPEGQGCPPLMCSSSADCDAAPLGTCMVNSCDNGQCLVREVESQGGPCPPAECMTSFDCAGATKDCSYKTCDDQECISVGVTVPASDPCPPDECFGDDLCGGSGGGIFEDVGF
jgi:hypothetical protein